MTGSHTPRRIACLQPSATVILDAIGELGRVVACTRYCAEVVPEVADGSRVILADSWTADTAEIVAARPDLVIASVPYQEEAVIEILKAGARFLGLAPKTLADVYADIAIIAGAVGAMDRGEAVVTAMQRRIDEVRSRTTIASRPRVWCEEWGKPVIASQAWVAELVEAAGGNFVGVAGGRISAEDVRELNPEVMILAWCGAGDRVPLEKIIPERGWQTTAAALSGSVYCIRDEFLNTPAPTLLQGLEALALAIHPEIFFDASKLDANKIDANKIVPGTKGIRRITGVRASADKNSAL
jgi:iron complex transport system substrate-binding protein